VAPTLTLRGGYAHTPSPVPAATLTPMTAAIVAHTIGAGVGVTRGRMQLDLGYVWSPTSSRRVVDTALQGREYDATSIGVGVQSLVVGVRTRF
jgi:long-subunit fatty acid transport protein